MLSLLLSCIIILPCIIGIGSLLSKKISLWEGICSDFILGLILLGCIWTLLAFVLPINRYIEIAFLIIGWFLFFYNQKHKLLFQILKTNYILFLSLVLCIAFLGSFYPFILDHFGYYVPQIKWISEFGIIKGLSNLELIQGQISIWHIIQAGFSHFADPYFRFNAIFMVGYCLYIIEKKTFLHLLFFPILFLFIQSPSPDLAVISLSMILLNEVILKNKNTLGLFLLSIFIFVIKPTMIWPPLLIIFYNFFYLRNKLNLKWMLPGLFLGALYILKNIWTFGYPIFPMSFLDFNISWKPHSKILEYSARFAIEKTYDNQYTYTEIINFSPLEYFKNWISLKGIKSIIHILFLIFVIGFTIYSCIKKKKLLYIVAFSLLIKSIVVLLFSAQYRFFLDVFFAISFIMLFQKLNKTFTIVIFIIGSFVASLFLSFPKLLQTSISSFRLGHMMNGFITKQFLKPATYEYLKYDTHQIGNLKFNVVKDYSFSFDTPLPAITPEFLQHYSDTKIFPQLIGSSINEGFKWKNLSEDEQKKLNKILDNWKESYRLREK